MFLRGSLNNNNVLHDDYFNYAILLLLFVACNFLHILLFCYFIIDIDECVTRNGGCHSNASCTNNIGAPRTCECKSGFSGDGISCAGK